MSDLDMAGCSSTPQITPEFVKSLETQLLIQKNILEESIKQYTTSNATMLKNLEIKCSKLKAMKRKVNDGKKRVAELKNTLQGLKKSNKELSAYILMLKINLKAYEEENITLAKDQEKSLEEADTKWQTYKEKYEQRPLAIIKTQEEIKFKRTKIKLMVKRYKLAEMKTMIKQREAINKKQRNHLVVDCVNLWKEAQLEDDKMLVTLETQNKLKKEVQTQESMIKELTKKHKEQLKTSQAPITNKIESMKIPFFAVPQFQRLKIPDKITPQPMPRWWNKNSDKDDISISSTLIDELIEPLSEASATELEESNHSESRAEAACPTSNEQKVNHQPDMDIPEVYRPITNVYSKDYVAYDEKFDSAVEEPVDSVENEKHKPMEKMTDDEESGMEHPDPPDYCIHDNEGEQEHRSSHVIDKSQKDTTAGFQPLQQKELKDDEIERPRVTSVEAVQFNLPPWTREFTKPMEEESLSHFRSQAELCSEFSWKPNNSPIMFTPGDSRRNAESDSILGTETSLQSEDMMKLFNVTFSPEMAGNKGGGNSQTTSQEVEGGIPIGQTERAPLFFGMNNFAARPTNRSTKEDPLFFNMF